MLRHKTPQTGSGFFGRFNVWFERVTNAYQRTVGRLIRKPGRHLQEAFPVSPDSLLQAETPSPIVEVFKKLVDGRKFHDLPRKIRAGLCRLDGALLLDNSETIKAVGAIVKTKGTATGGTEQPPRRLSEKTASA